MEIAKIIVNATTGRCLLLKRIPARIVGATVTVEFCDPVWDRLTKTVVFRGSETKIAKFDGKTAVIPWEVVQEPGQVVLFGIWGSDPESDLQLPLIEVMVGTVEDATDPNADPSTDPTLPIWAQLQEQIDELKENGVPGGYPGNAAQLVQQAVSQHNTSDDSHGDIRLELKAVSDRLTAFFDSDDQTLDELSEIVAYITSNKTLIEAVTTSKVSVSDIINNLVTNASNKPLSAAQGAVLKNLIDSVSNRLSDYQPKGDYLKRAELPSGAKVGQIVKIAEVDDKGIPSKWEAIDLPDSGGNVAQGLTAEQIAALDGMFKVCAFTKADVSAEYNAFKTAFGVEDSGEEEPDVPVIPPDEPDEPDIPEVTLSSISATYNGGDVAVGTAVADLTGIVVTATYSDGSTETVTGYTLSGEIAEGSNTVTVSYGGKTATFTVTGIAESGGDSADIHDGYISDGLEFRLDAIRNTESGHSSAQNYMVDVSGNGYAIENYQNLAVMEDTYLRPTDAGYQRSSHRIIDYATILAKMATFTIEVVWQPENKAEGIMVDLGNYNFVQGDGRIRLFDGTDKLYGTAVNDVSTIKHYTITYDGTNMNLYHEGVLDVSQPATTNITTATDLEFFGNRNYANYTKGYFNAARIYTRSLTAEEVKANYDNDIARLGTVNVEVA